MKKKILFFFLFIPFYGYNQIGTGRTIERFYASAEVGPTVFYLTGDDAHDESWYKPGPVLNTRIGVRFFYKTGFGIQLGVTNSFGSNSGNTDDYGFESVTWRKTTFELGTGYAFGATGQNLLELNFGVGNMTLHTDAGTYDFTHTGTAAGVLRMNLSFYINEKLSFTWSLGLEYLENHEMISTNGVNPMTSYSGYSITPIMPDMGYAFTSFGLMYNFP